MGTDIRHIDGFQERETVTGQLRTRVFHLDEPLVVLTPDGEKQFIWAGAIVLVIDRSEQELALQDTLLDLSELLMHYRWGRSHNNAPTHTPLDLRTVANGGREDEQIPF